jgi:hypothetical protein
MSYIEVNYQILNLIKIRSQSFMLSVFFSLIITYPSSLPNRNMCSSTLQAAWTEVSVAPKRNFIGGLRFYYFRPNPNLTPARPTFTFKF